MKRYIRSTDNPNVKRTSLGKYIENYLKDNYGYKIYENWSYYGRAHKSSDRIAKLYYLDIPYSDIQAAVDDAINASPCIADKIHKYPYLYKIDVFDKGEVSTTTSGELVQGVIVQVNNVSIYVDKTTGEVVEV